MVSLGLIGILMSIKLAIPLGYKETSLHPIAIAHVKGLQAHGEVDPMECAARYLYFMTDYDSETPDRIRVSQKRLSDERVRITLHDPSCHDDSVSESIRRIYLERDQEGDWVPVRHEWSHKGRGRIGWTTRPTS